MAKTLDLDEVESRSKRYWNADGLPELVMGLLWILWGGSWLFGASLPRASTTSNLYWTVTPLVLVVSSLAAVWAIKMLKARITFPRAGYVAWNPPTRGQRLTGAAVALVGAAVLVVVISKARAAGLEHVAVPALGVILSLGFIVASITQKAPHLLLLAAVALVLGLALGWVTPGSDDLNWMFIAVGAATAILGGARLWMFLRAHPMEERA